MKSTLLTISIVLSLGAISAQAAPPTLSNHTGVAATSVNHPIVAAPQGTFTFTESGSNTITSGNSVSCNGGTPTFYHTDNSYYRRFNLDGDFSATGMVNVTSVDFGIETAVGNGGTQPVTVKLYAIPNASALTLANLGSAVATANVSVPNQNLTIFNAPISGAINAVTSDLVVEIFTPNGAAPAMNEFFIGSNATASVNPPGAPSYIAAAGCGITEPATTASIGFAGMNIVMTVHASSLPVTLQEYTID